MSTSEERDREERILYMTKNNEALLHHLERERVKSESLLDILMGIHALLYPPRVTLADGRVFAFHSPIVEEQMQALSDRIRAIPEELRKAQEVQP